MFYEYAKLLGRIKECCGSQSVFAKKMNLSERTISLKLNSKKEWKQSEIKQACEILNINNSEIPVYFFKAKVQN